MTDSSTHAARPAAAQRPPQNFWEHLTRERGGVIDHLHTAQSLLALIRRAVNDPAPIEPETDGFHIERAALLGYEQIGDALDNLEQALRAVPVPLA